ncbi:hypothetical protein NAI02_11435, partial [Francisella tularensis subsp. holarctica]|nr:hypothetical protein [Francisella tularensis subsp. holarctica]
DLSKDINRMIIRNSSIEKLDFNRCEFETVPSFDDKSSIKHSVDIYLATFNNLLKVDKCGSLEFSRLAEFFNRNNAYREA